MTRQTKFSDTDLCVKCGLCLPVCPTYTLTKNEAESPRGRLALIQGYAKGALSLSDSLRSHINSCLSCRACENMCPANVPYSQLMNEFKAETDSSSQQHLSLFENLAINALTGKNKIPLPSLLRLYQASGLSNLPLSINEPLPKTANIRSLKAKYASLAPTKLGHVALFTGCASKAIDPTTLHDAVFMLQHCGFDVSIPPSQTCCGAIDLHSGEKEAYNALSLQNTTAFTSNQYDTVITVATGCGSTLAGYDNGLASNIIDISDFIAPYIASLSFSPLAASAWLHTPCSLKNTAHGSKKTDISTLLSNIETLDIHVFDDSQHCCGAAGTHMLTHKETANALREKVIQPIKQHATHYLLSSNIGCAMHLRTGLKQAGLNTEVLHPVSLLAQQLQV